jgi:hypothetical protein
MKQRPSIYYSESQKALMRERWRKGETIHQSAKLSIGATPRYSGYSRRPAASSHRKDTAHRRH